MDMSVYSIEQIKERVAPIAERYGVRRVMLFGSYARGDATEDSDIDLHIEAGEIKDLFALADFRLDLEDCLNKKVDVVTTGALRRRFYEQIRGEEVTLYGSYLRVDLDIVWETLIKRVPELYEKCNGILRQYAALNETALTPEYGDEDEDDWDEGI
jgi:predicted nucleotidyltransferase